MRFLADMGISPKTVAYLQGLGHDATHLHAQSLDRLEDSAIVDKAHVEGRILLPHDLDFGELIAASGASGASLPSVIVFRLRNMHPGSVNWHLQRIINQHRELLVQGAIVSVTEGRIRVRVLPIEASA